MNVKGCILGIGTAVFTFVLSGCAMAPDRFGYENRPFGTDKKFSGTLAILSTPADELGAKCLDANGYLAPDARACTVPQDARCTVLIVPNASLDRRQALLNWANAICSGWRPGVR